MSTNACEECPILMYVLAYDIVNIYFFKAKHFSYKLVNSFHRDLILGPLLLMPPYMFEPLNTLPHELDMIGT